MLYLIGLAGLYMLFRSTRFAYRPRNAYILLIIGFVTTIIVVYYSGQLLLQKSGG
jgi:ABC-type microcin C transport system permease subunit YejB